jgi:hypothetical protein
MVSKPLLYPQRNEHHSLDDQMVAIFLGEIPGAGGNNGGRLL